MERGTKENAVFMCDCLINLLSNLKKDIKENDTFRLTGFLAAMKPVLKELTNYCETLSKEKGR